MIKDNFIGQIFPQNCGDSILVLEKTENKQYTNYLYRCIFQKYPYECLSIKGNIIKGVVNNPLIEENEFIGKEFLQNCGDILKIFRKTNKKYKETYLYECEFIKYPYKCFVRKQDILKGKVLNPEIENNEFIGKEFLQNCGDTLKVIKKTNIKDAQNHHYLYECEFIKYPYKCLVTKQVILNKGVLNHNLPYYSKENLKKYIQENFKDKKPTLTELSESLKISKSRIGNSINNFNLKEYISYDFKISEDKIYQFIKSLDDKLILKQNYCYNKDKRYYELDIFIPKFNLGIEYNGNYWHSNIFKQQNYHQKKSTLAKDIDTQLIHIFEYEWNDLRQQEILKSLIKSKLGIFEKKIFARKCEIKELDYKTYASFCNENHLQGEAGAKVKLGLYYQNKLVQIMSFGVPRFTDKYEWEIIRECSKLGYIIVGGKEKLWKYFIKKYNPSSVLSYCDFSKFSGESYLRLGFKKISLNKPGFVWWDKNKDVVYWRNPYKHKEMKDAGYLKIYDAGQLVFEWYNKNLL